MTLEELDVDVPDEYVKSSEYLKAVKAEKLTNELLNMTDAPTCIFYPDDFDTYVMEFRVRWRNGRYPLCQQWLVSDGRWKRKSP